MQELSLEKLYGILKTYELEQAQTKKRYGWGKTVGAARALVVEEPVTAAVQRKVSVLPLKSVKKYVISEEGPTSTTQSDDDDEYYSMEELEQLEDESLAMFAKKFGNMRFKKNASYKYKPSANIFQKGKFSSYTSKGGYKTEMVDRSKFMCFNSMNQDTLSLSARSQRCKGKRMILMKSSR